MKKHLALLFAVLLAAPAWAAAPEKCGDGIDDPLQTGGSANGTKGACPAGYMDSVVGNGCDLKCPGVDQDDDGYTSDGTTGTAGGTSIDCDDADKSIYPGVYTTKGCSGGQFHKCQTDGTYTSCTSTTLAEGSHANYYIDCTSGNDANAGTYGSPFKTLGKVSGGSGASGLPASPVTLQGDDYVYIIGGTCNTTITASAATGFTSLAVLAELNVSGTSGHPIVFRIYPGASPTLSNSNGGGIVGTGSYIEFWGSGAGSLFDMSTSRTSAANAMAVSFTGSSTTHTFEGLYVHDNSMHGDNNDSCVYFPHTNAAVVNHSYFYNCKRSTGNVDNIGAITWLDNHDTANECQNHSAQWNTIWWDVEDDTNGGNCFKEKHGCNSADVGSNKHQIKNNTCINPRHAIHWEGSSMRFDNNYIYGTPTILYLIAAGGADNSKHQDNQFTNNTVYNSSFLAWNEPTFAATDQKLTVTGNVFIDNKASYVAGNSEGILSIAGYGSDANLTTFESNNQLVSNNNCFYNGSTSISICYFCQSGGIGWGPAGAAGGNYGVSSWKALSPGYDANSYEENPTLNSYLVPTSTNCSTKGRTYTSSNIGGPVMGSGRGRFFRGRLF